MIRNISVGIDVGSGVTRVLVGEFIKGEKNPKIIGAGESETRGMRRGYVVDPVPAAESIKEAVAAAEKSSGIKIKRAFISAGGISLRGEWSTGTAIITKADGEVTNLDVNKALEDCEDNLNLNNKKVIQIFPMSYRLDGKEVLGRLEGMRGNKLEVRALILTYSLQHLEDLIAVLAEAGVEALDIIGSPLALSQVALSDKQKIVGVALVDIGRDTTTLSVFENGLPIYIYTFPIGGVEITNDIALGFKIPLDHAERMKQGEEDENFSSKKLSEIIEARLSDIFELIENHLKKIKRSELLPAGIVFSGGGSNTLGTPELAKDILKLPASRASTDIFGNLKTKLRDPSWFVALGLLMGSTYSGGYNESPFGNIFKSIKNTVKSSLKQLMP